ncbi:short chain dehydrogenase [Sedimenticola sp.]|uniref:short chain dehydrogenase n=1 Tax=Sedimenticola sp. TaxID=1940285 RepID=UPI003D137CF3
MKIVVLGATGTIGSAVINALGDDQEVIKVGKSNGDMNVDITDSSSIHRAFDQIGPFDALVVATGDVAFNAFDAMKEEEWSVGLHSKLMGQVNATRAAIDYLNPNGSITLTTGILSDEPIAWGTSASTINGAVEHFVRAVSTELPKGIRINAVSPSLLEESVGVYGNFFPGFIPVPGARVAQAYVKSILGVATGQVYKVI